MSETKAPLEDRAPDDYFGAAFALHLSETQARLRTIEVFLGEWAAGGWGRAVDRGWRAQWAALLYLTLLGADLLAAIAASPQEHAVVADFAERRAELLLAYEAHRHSLDFSRDG